MYRIKTNERNNDKATEYETKSLLYLLTKIRGHKKIDIFIIDCFNDITGANSDFVESWDVQSKGVATLSPKKIGAALYTLFANYVSDIDFTHYSNGDLSFELTNDLVRKNIIKSICESIDLYSSQISELILTFFIRKPPVTW